MNTESIHLGAIQVRYLIDGSATGSLGVFELSVLTGARVPPAHSHQGNDECVYGLEPALPQQPAAQPGTTVDHSRPESPAHG